MLRHLRKFFRETTIHGFRFLVDGTSLLEKALWFCLIVLSLLACTFLILSSFRDTAENPFLTSVDSIPIQQLPFPAVSVDSLDSRQLNPWQNFLRQVMDSLVFDCVHDDRDGNCSDDSRRAREDLSYLIDAAVEKAYDRMVQKGLAVDPGEVNHQLVCPFATYYGVDGLQRFGAFPEILGNATDETMAEFRGLAKQVFRRSAQEAISHIDSFIARHINYTLSYNCHGPYSGLSKDVVVKILAMLIAQGGATRPIPLGQLLDYQLSYSSWSYPWDPELQKVVHLLYPVLELLFPGSNLRLTKPNEYLLASHGASSIVWAPHGWPDTRNCTVFLAIMSQINTNRQEDFCAQDEECCKVQAEIAASYPSVLKLMKFSLQPHTWARQEARDLEEITEGIETLGYPSKATIFTATNPAIYASVLHGVGEEVSAPTFRRSFSNKGISFTFNADPFWHIFKDMPSTNAFYEEVHAVKGTREEDEQLPIHPQANGPLFALEMLINTPDTGRLIAVHQPSVLPDLINEPIEIYPGNTYDVLITPSVTQIEDEVKKMNPYSKNCISALNENHLKMFRNYSKSACMLECKLTRAAEACGCIPWDYPRINDTVPICHFYTKLCFREEMAKGVTPSECSCLNDCDSVSYTRDIIVKPSQKRDYCYPFWLEHIEPWYARNKFFRVASSTFEEMTYRMGAEEDRCENKIEKELAVVKIYFGPAVAAVTTRSLRVTFTDRVANIGEGTQHVS